MIETTTIAKAFTTEHTESTENCCRGSASPTGKRRSAGQSVSICVHLWFQRSAFLCALGVLFGGLALLSACESTRTDPGSDVPEEKPDQEIITGELQSDFLELGPAAGVQWLSFYPDDFLEYPELFEGLDQDQRKRTRLAPREGANKVLLKFDLPAGAKIKPVDWYGTECVAVDLPNLKGFTIALARADQQNPGHVSGKLAEARKAKLGKDATGLWSSADAAHRDQGVFGTQNSRGQASYAYVSRTLTGTASGLLVVVEAVLSPAIQGVEDAAAAITGVLNSVKLTRELALEGSPKHQCKSSIEDLKAGVVAYEKGGLKLALPEGWELRKSGGSSTVEIHGGGAKPLALIRKLVAKDGSLKTRVGADTVFSRRKARPDGFFGAGRALTEQEPFVVAFDYKDRSAEQVALCVVATGNEWLTVEVIGTGVIEGEARRKLRDACLDMLKNAKPSAGVANRVKDLNELVGWKPQ